jgi:ABC-type multidrug transport system ATPase subunit
MATIDTGVGTGAGAAVAAVSIGARRLGMRVDVRGIVQRVQLRRGRTQTLLHDISFTVRPGELVAIAGGSGAGKTTLLNTLAGIQRPAAGRVCFDGVDFYADPSRFRPELGYVPQDDIVHKELSVARTLHFAARLRLPAGAGPAERAAAAARVLTAVDLSGQAEQRVASLSGGQRKRVSIGVELLTEPRLIFLDEPTSGLDPSTGRDLLRQLRVLADAGSTVLLTTHAPQDIGLCDRVLFLAPGGYLAFAGTPDAALAYFGAQRFEEIYDRLAHDATPQEWAGRLEAVAGEAVATDELPPPEVQPTMAPANRRSGQPIGPLTQWAVLSRRSLEILTGSRLTLAILMGCPLMVIAMFAVLFRPRSFEFSQPDPSAALNIVFWVGFGAFFFGLTYGLLAICTELAIFRRERVVNLRIVPYVLSKVAVLVPVLVLVLIAQFAVLRLLNRLPDAGPAVYGAVFVSALLDGVSAVALGLLASAAVTEPSQATLVLPVLCFPQVLFSGGMLAVPAMAAAGKAISAVTSVRWTFEAVGESFALNNLYAHGNSPLGPPLLAQYQDSFSRAIWQDWAILAVFTLVFLAGTCWVLARKSAVSR